MSREIKFRAWDKENKLMSDPVNPFENQNTKFRMDDDYTASVPTSDISSVYGYQHILMQYTGIKDKNGTEIYEGDIIESKNALGVVKWHTLWASFYMSVVYGRNEYGEMVRMISARPMYNDWNSVEIIGNIYENADLLANTVSEYKPTQSTSV